LDFFDVGHDVSFLFLPLSVVDAEEVPGAGTVQTASRPVILCIGYRFLGVFWSWPEFCCCSDPAMVMGPRG
jgi:hypothetical protein